MDTENLGTSAVIERISFCTGLAHHVNSGDKEPSWDGHIYVYKDDIKDKKKKSELIGRVPIQVKGISKTIKKSSYTFRYRADVSDLQNYAHDGGAIYFVVAICDDRSKLIFYKSLLPYDLKIILRDAKSAGKVPITLRKLPDDDKAVRQIFLSFIGDRNRQATKIVWTQEQAEAAIREGAELKFHLQPKDELNNPFDIMREMTTQPYYLYAKTKEGVEFPFAKIDEDSYKIAKSRIDASVKIRNVSYYDHFYIGCENGNKYVYIGESIRMPINNVNDLDEQAKFIFYVRGTLFQRIADTSFLLSLSQHHELEISDYWSCGVNMTNPKENAQLQELHEHYVRVKAAIEYFGVNADLNLDSLSDSDYQNLGLLIKASEGHKVFFSDKGLPSLFYYNQKIGNLSIRILAKKDPTESGHYLNNAFAKAFCTRLDVVDDSGKTTTIEPWSPFLNFVAEDFMCTNLNNEIVLSSIKEMEAESLAYMITISGKHIVSGNIMLLEIIKAYDTKKDKQLLSLALDIADVLLSKEPVTLINKMQIIKRLRPFSHDEVAKLVYLQNRRKQKKVIKCAVSVLLDDASEAEKLLGELSEDDRKQIIDYPIYSLMKSQL